ncbi:SPOR domain-containing protein [Acanthopleuribacter pedis]|uniref:SPOR domain-containing protein n=1 Tax=Acanthopleuribacter pedis TaxID=442870 RepID=A0A8J7U5X9_9BACT|nr:SPOR domain-containing protein [Acanthopleuribacter pedis]MBO1321314.1 SPOR domain-containing protein [Acanthopleuribacter pedis]
MNRDRDGIFLPRRMVFLLIAGFVCINVFFLLMGILIGKDDLKWNEKLENPDLASNQPLIDPNLNRSPLEEELSVFEDEVASDPDDYVNQEPDYLNDTNMDRLTERVETPPPVTTAAAERSEPEPTRPVVKPRPKPPANKVVAKQAAELRGGFWIQILAGSEKNKVEDFRKKVSARGYGTALISESGMYKIQVGPYRNRPEADQAAAKLKRVFGVSTWIRER